MGAVHASVLLGPSAAVTLSTDISEDSNSQTEVLPEDSVRRIELGMASGLELGYSPGTASRLTVGTHYDLGLSPLTTDAAVEQGKEDDLRNDVLALTIGYTYSFGR